MLNVGETGWSSEINTFKNNWIYETKEDDPGTRNGRRGNGQDPYGQGNLLSLHRNFTTAASQHTSFYRTQYNETVGEISARFLNSAGNPVGWAATRSAGDSFYRVYDIYNFLVNVLEKDAVNTTNTHCNSSVVHACTGLCKGTCRVACENSCTSAHGNCSNVNTAGSWPNPR